jgi:hypothetical protein
MTDEQRVQRWNSWLDAVGAEILSTAHFDNVFWQVQAVLGANSEINKGQAFPQWIRHAYIQTMMASLRRLVDRTSGTVSLHRLLADMARHCTVLSRERYCAMHGEGEGADAWFTDLADGEHDHIPRGRILALSEGLDSAVETVAKYANHAVAHRSERPVDFSVTFGDGRVALAQATFVYEWCLLVLRSQAMATCVPSIQGDWLSCMRVPWLPPGAPVPGYRHLDRVRSDPPLSNNGVNLTLGSYTHPEA